MVRLGRVGGVGVGGGHFLGSFGFEDGERNLRGVEELGAVAPVEDFKLDALRDAAMAARMEGRESIFGMASL